MHRVSAVRPAGDYRLHVRFEDGVEGEVDLSGLVGSGVFEAWRDPAEFLKVAIDPESHTLAWPGGIDLCPDRLYQDVSQQAGVCCARDKPPAAPDDRKP
jgi:hypothetical protein